MKKLCIIAIALAGMSASVFAQSEANANASASIVATIAIVQVDDLEFGNVAVTGTAGTVVLEPEFGGRQETGGVTLPATTGVFNAAEFTITGEPDYTYDITLPSGDETIIGTSTSQQMIVNTFTSFPSGSGILDVSGEQTLFVGATLNVSANQAPDFYEMEGLGFEVSVNYN